MGKSLYTWQHGFNKPGELAFVAQHNSVLWTRQTVHYHLHFYYELSGRSSIQQEGAIDELLKALDLYPFIEV